MILISKSDANFLCGVLALEASMVTLLADSSNEKIKLTEEQADALRDLCGERLQNHGFDENYKVTSEGEQLERLIDKLFVG